MEERVPNQEDYTADAVKNKIANILGRETNEIGINFEAFQMLVVKEMNEELERVRIILTEKSNPNDTSGITAEAYWVYLRKLVKMIEKAEASNDLRELFGAVKNTSASRPSGYYSRQEITPSEKMTQIEGIAKTYY